MQKVMKAHHLGQGSRDHQESVLLQPINQLNDDSMTYEKTLQMKGSETLNLDHLSKELLEEVRNKLTPNRYMNKNRQGNHSHTVQLEGIYVRKHNGMHDFEINPDKDQFKLTPKKPYHMRKMSNPEQSYAIRSKELNLASIPDSIRTEAILNTSATVGPKTKFRSISTRRMTEMEPLSSHRTKRIEDITTIINRVVRLTQIDMLNKKSLLGQPLPIYW